mgnify:CR=1 FL=1
MGQEYVTVTAEMANNNGIMFLNGSDEGEGGGTESGSYWIGWTPEGGFTGDGWRHAWDSNNVPLKDKWMADPADGYEKTYEGFYNYVTTVQPTDLNQWLGTSWNNYQKYAFAHDEYPNIWMNCMSPIL